MPTLKEKNHKAANMSILSGNLNLVLYSRLSTQLAPNPLINYYNNTRTSDSCWNFLSGRHWGEIMHALPGSIDTHTHSWVIVNPQFYR